MITTIDEAAKHFANTSAPTEVEMANKTVVTVSSYAEAKVALSKKARKPRKKKED